MAYRADILLDSISPDGVRLTTFEVEIPRMMLAEFNTHRMLSRNSASNRAIPLAKSLERIWNDPFVPEVFSQEKKGMQGGIPLEGQDAIDARKAWYEAMDDTLVHAAKLGTLGAHKSLANRLLEPFQWQVILVTATEWSNFFALRTDSEAQTEIRKPVQMMEDLFFLSEPQSLGYGEWHCPLIGTAYIDALQNENWEKWKKVSVGRCARVSALTHDGKRDLEKDVELHDRLLESRHMSPFEHVATPMRHRIGTDNRFANFKGWRQYRWDILNEDDYGKVIDNGSTP